ncbi:MAG TPA: hypothetical protein VGB05_10295 [Pyrinomonadaceae bacterium]
MKLHLVLFGDGLTNACRQLLWVKTPQMLALYFADGHQPLLAVNLDGKCGARVWRESGVALFES